jgi:hypothetical protein
MTTKQETIQLTKQTAAIKNTRLEMERELAELDRIEADTLKALLAVGCIEAK